jgi:hypothetical protein
MSEDFSLKWFGIPDAIIVKFWDKLKRLPKYNSEHYIHCQNNKLKWINYES